MATNALRRADGFSVDVALSYEVDTGDIVVVQDWLGIVPRDAESGDSIALNVENAEFDMILPTSLSLGIGDEVYVEVADVTGHRPDSTAYSTSSGAGKRKLGRCTTAQDGTTGQVRILTTLINQ